MLESHREQVTVRIVTIIIVMLGFGAHRRRAQDFKIDCQLYLNHFSLVNIQILIRILK